MGPEKDLGDIVECLRVVARVTSGLGVFTHAYPPVSTFQHTWLVTVLGTLSNVGFHYNLSL